MSSRLLGNGIDGATGGYLVDLQSRDLLPQLSPPTNLEALRKQVAALEPSNGVLFGYDPRILAEVGWGLVLPEPRDATERTRNAQVVCALAPLLKLRAAQAKDRFKILEVRHGESREQFLARHNQGPAPINPARVPYYFLIAADPEAIGFDFQCSLDVLGAVGRLAFSDANTLRTYAERVVAADSGAWDRNREISFIGIANDPWTTQSATNLVTPLHAGFSVDGWTKEDMPLLGLQATRDQVLARLGFGRKPGITFIATHGVGYPFDHALQRENQGALVCQEWPGHGRIPGPEHLIAAKDLDGADLEGAVCVLFACFGLGTPRRSDFQHLEPKVSSKLTSRAFCSRLAEGMLERGALAVLGHVERAWGWSYEFAKISALDHFQNALTQIARGLPVGAALEDFAQRYADLATILAREIEYRDDKMPDPEYIATLFTIVNDARGWAMFGDPAVRIPAVRTVTT